MRNFEIKVTLPDKQTVIKRLKIMGAQYQYTMQQCDYYFVIGEGKEKLRVIDDQEYQLIIYRREEKHGRKDSHYDIKELSAEDKDRLLNQRHVIKQVEKTRELWLLNNTRVHIDYVKCLGDFLELETVVRDISVEVGENEFRTVVDKLGIDPARSVAASYSDLVPILA